MQYPADLLTNGVDALGSRDPHILSAIKQEDGILGKTCTEGMMNGYSLTGGTSPRDGWYKESLGFRSTGMDRTTNLQTATSNGYGTQMAGVDWTGRGQSSQYPYGSSLSVATNSYSHPTYGWEAPHAQTHAYSTYGVTSPHGMLLLKDFSFYVCETFK